MASKILPAEFIAETEASVTRFNNEQLAQLKNSYQFVVQFRGKFIYLMLNEYGKVSPAGRLTYNGDPKELDFAIFRWSTEKYDEDAYLFPGAECLDGTVLGAMKAICKAYPAR